MNDVVGVKVSSIASALWGQRVVTLMDRCAVAWPWEGARMVGECRCAVAWPMKGAAGCFAVGMMGPDKLLYLPVVERFTQSCTEFVVSGGVVEGLALMLSQVTVWGVRVAHVQMDDGDLARVWVDMVKKDSAFKGCGMMFDGAPSTAQCMEVLRDMLSQVVVLREVGVEMTTANARGEVGPLATAVAILAQNFKRGVVRP